jgi:TolB-like protein
MPPEIFASYSREDQAQVFPIVNKLRERGLNIWIDQEGIHGAKLWSQEIVNAIENSKVFILFASAKAFLSKNVTKELALASESDKHILPIFIEDAEIPTAMKYQLAGIQHLVHEQGQTEQTADNILRTLGNLDIQSAEPQPTAATTPTDATKPASKTPLVAAALIIALAVIAFLLFRGDSTQETSATAATAKTYKSTIDLCVVTVSEDGEGSKVSKENRELRDELSAKLARFSDYKVIRGETLSPDATTQEFLELVKKVDADFILQVAIDSDQKRVNALLFDGNDGRNFWTKSLTDKDIDSDKSFVDEATGIVAAHIAGHDGAIHRNLLKKALVKKEEDLTPMELLQLAVCRT